MENRFLAASAAGPGSPRSMAPSPATLMTSPRPAPGLSSPRMTNNATLRATQAASSGHAASGHGAAVSPLSGSSRRSSAHAAHFEIMRRASNYYAVKRDLWEGEGPATAAAVSLHQGTRPPALSDEEDAKAAEGSTTKWADWLFDEADLMQPGGDASGSKSSTPPKPRLSRPRDGVLPERPQPPLPAMNRDLSHSETLRLLPLLSLTRESVFAEVGLHCRGRLPLNLSLNFEAKEYLSINPSLQRTVDASKICSPVIQSGLAKGPVRFVCADLNSWHYRGITHLLLHNKGLGGVSEDSCRAIAGKLAQSESFTLLVTTAPLPFQHYLVFVGEADLKEGCGSTAVGIHLTSTGPVRYPAGLEAPGEAALEAQTYPAPTMAPSCMVYLYALSFSSAPVGTLAQLYCRDGVCCLPPGGAQLGGRRRSSGGSSGGGGRLLELPPLASHTAAYLDLCSSLEMPPNK